MPGNWTWRTSHRSCTPQVPQHRWLWIRTPVVSLVPHQKSQWQMDAEVLPPFLAGFAPSFFFVLTKARSRLHETWTTGHIFGFDIWNNHPSIDSGGFHNPNWPTMTQWPTYIFRRGRVQPPTRLDIFGPMGSPGLRGGACVREAQRHSCQETMAALESLGRYHYDPPWIV